MISNIDQKVDQEKYGNEFDRIFRRRFSYGDSISGTIKWEPSPEIKNLIDGTFKFAKICRGRGNLDK